ncbi:hypothetical protein BC643_2499 [Mangrovibacterium diazotrophicum]|uniref:Uncharacterized protein n=1 Tax=Mangrovibacterium diazotrophicum TaxID=1261403 RepID=A0A419W9K1_9BACT|nr:hypothetical protein BC643_2499 [Mangrovibacterium diazotrophicum]
MPQAVACRPLDWIRVLRVISLCDSPDSRSDVALAGSPFRELEGGKDGSMPLMFLTPKSPEGDFAFEQACKIFLPCTNGAVASGQGKALLLGPWRIGQSPEGAQAILFILLCTSHGRPKWNDSTQRRVRPNHTHFLSKHHAPTSIRYDPMS